MCTNMKNKHRKTSEFIFKHHKALVAYIGMRSQGINSKREKRKADLLAAISSHIRTVSGECFPSQGRLASLAGISVRTVKTYCDELAEEGILTITCRKHLNKSNLFVLHFHRLADWFCRRNKISKDILRSNTTGMTSIDEIVADAIQDQTVTAKAKTIARKMFDSFFSKKQVQKVKREVAPPEQEQQWAVPAPVTERNMDVAALRKGLFGRTTRKKHGGRRQAVHAIGC